MELCGLWVFKQKVNSIILVSFPDIIINNLTTFLLLLYSPLHKIFPFPIFSMELFVSCQPIYTPPIFLCIYLPHSLRIPPFLLSWPDDIYPDSPLSIAPKPLSWQWFCFTILVSLFTPSSLCTHILRFGTRNLQCEKMWCLSFWIWVTFLSMIFSSSIDLPSKFMISFSLWMNSNPLHMCKAFAISSCWLKDI